MSKIIVKNIFFLLLLLSNINILPQIGNSIEKQTIYRRFEGKGKIGIPNIIVFIEGNGQNSYTISKYRQKE